MSACNFSIPFSGSASAIINKARTAVQGQGGEFTGDDSAGNFTVSLLGNTVKGSYSVMAQQLQIVIDSKPFFVPCSAIEGYLKKELAG